MAERLIVARPAAVGGLTSEPAGGGRHSAGGGSSPARGMMENGLKLAAI
jgi:hypothetical protein